MSPTSFVRLLALSVLGMSCTADRDAQEGERGRTFPADPPLPHLPPFLAMCLPETAGPHWLLEGEPLSVTVGCGSAMSIDEAGITLGVLPEGAVWDAASGELSWTPGLDQAALYEIPVTATHTGESALLRISVADAWDHADNIPVVDPLRYPEEYGVPVFFLSSAPTTKTYVPATIVHGGHTYEAEAKIRGAASLAYPKLSYTFSFTKADKFQEPSRDFHDKRKINLHSGFDDNSHLRNRLAFDTWNRMDPAHIRMQSYSAVLYIDGEYWGLYTVIDHIDGFLMEDHGYDQDGDMFKAILHSANLSLSFDGSVKSTPHDGYEKTEGFPIAGEPGAWTDLDELVTFVDQADDAAFRVGIASRVDLRDYQDWWILSVLLFANDSVAKNSYHFHDAGPFRFIPWDYNASFGQNWRTVRYDWDQDDVFADDNHLFERFLQDPELQSALDVRYAQVMSERVPAAAMLERIDQIAAEIGPSARRDERKWSPAYRSFTRWAHRDDFTTWEEEVAYVRQWTSERWALEEERLHDRME